MADPPGLRLPFPGLEDDRVGSTGLGLGFRSFSELFIIARERELEEEAAC